MPTPHPPIEPKPRPSRPSRPDPKPSPDAPNFVDATPAWFQGVDAVVWTLSVEEWRALLSEADVEVAPDS